MRNTVSAWIYVAIAVLTVINAFVSGADLRPVLTGLIILFLILQFVDLPRGQKIAGPVMIGIALISAAVSGEWRAIVIDGTARASLFLLLFFAISWLKYPVERSPSLQSVRTYIVEQTPGKRFLYLAFGAHFLGTVLNLAGLSLLTTVLEKQEDPVQKRRLSVALMQGFTSASCWSPFYIGMVVVLVALPSLSWGELAPTGFLMAVLVILAAWIFDRLFLRRGRRRVVDGPPAFDGRATALASVILLALIILVVTPAEMLLVSIPITLGIVAPPFALLWYKMQADRLKLAGVSLSGLAKGVVTGLPSMRNETMMFGAATMFGVGISHILPSADLSAGLNALVPWADAKLILLILTFTVTSLAGLHPVILVISLSAIFPPEALGLTDWIVGLTYLGCWGMCTMISPFSGTTLFMARVTGVPSHIIGWRWSPPLFIVGVTVVGIVVITARHLTR